MIPNPSDSHTAFEGHRLLAAGSLADVALAVKQALAARRNDAVLVFQDSTGKQVDLDVSGDDAQIAVDLHGIGIDDDTAAGERELQRQRRLPAGGRACDKHGLANGPSADLLLAHENLKCPSSPR